MSKRAGSEQVPQTSWRHDVWTDATASAPALRGLGSQANSSFSDMWQGQLHSAYGSMAGHSNSISDDLQHLPRNYFSHRRPVTVANQKAAVQAAPVTAALSTPTLGTATLPAFSTDSAAAPVHPAPWMKPSAVDVDNQHIAYEPPLAASSLSTHSNTTWLGPSDSMPSPAIDRGAPARSNADAWTELLASVMAEDSHNNPPARSQSKPENENPFLLQGKHQLRPASMIDQTMSQAQKELAPVHNLNALSARSMFEQSTVCASASGLGIDNCTSLGTDKSTTDSIRDQAQGAEASEARASAAVSSPAAEPSLLAKRRRGLDKVQSVGTKRANATAARLKLPHMVCRAIH